MRFSILRSATPCGLVALLAVLTTPALAATGTWSGGAGAIWDTSATNWTSLTGTPWDASNGGSNTAVFQTANFTSTVSGTVWANAITFNATGTVSGGTITLTGSTPTITAASARIATIDSVIDGSAGLTIASGGTLVLNGVNTYSGTTSISTTASLTLGNAAALGTSVLATKSTLTAGTPLTGANKVTNNLLVSSFTIGGSNAIDLGGTFTQNTSGQTVTVNNSGATTFSGPMWILAGTASNATLTFAGSSDFTISGAIGRDSGGLSNSTWGNLRYAGTGTMTLSGTNSFGGNLSVYGGGAVSYAGATALGGNATLQVGSNASAGTLLYTGGGETIGKTVRVGTSAGDTGMTGILDHSGSGLLSYSAITTSAASVGTPAPTGTLILRGSTSGTGRITGVVGQATAVTLSVQKEGSGSWQMAGVNTYSGSTTITGGLLEVTGGNINGSSGVTVNGLGAELRYSSSTPLTAPLTITQGRLSGTGSIGTAVAFGPNAILAPGNSPGTQPYTAGLSLINTTLLDFELDATNFTAGGGINDLIAVTGDLVLDGVLDVASLGGGDFSSVADGSFWTLLTYSGALTNNGLNLGSLPSLGGGGRTYAVDTETSGLVKLVVVPEPGAVALAGLGITAAGGLLIRRRRGG